jgi:hypothetical protein
MRRRLLETVGESPTALRDLSVSLNNVGRVAREQGRLEEAEKAFAESAGIRKRLQEWRNGRVRGDFDEEA